MKDSFLTFIIVWFAVSTANAREPRSANYDRLDNAIMCRIGPDGETYGGSEPEPLLWSNSTYLQQGESHDEFAQALPAFSSQSDAAQKAYSDIERALLQRLLWNVFDWFAERRLYQTNGDFAAKQQTTRFHAMESQSILAPSRRSSFLTKTSKQRSELKSGN